VRKQDGKTFRPSVDKRLGELFSEFLRMSQAIGYPLIGATEANAQGKKQGGVGSFACRAIKGSNPPAPSNHSSATALDLYTRSNPQYWSENVRFASTIHPNMVELAAAADIYWGGWYWDTSKHKYLDAMHFEYMLRPSDVASSLARLRDKFKQLGGSGGGTPTPPTPIPTPGGDVTPAQIKALQKSLNDAGTTPELVIDGVYGPATETAVIELPNTVSEQVELAESTSKADTKEAAKVAIDAI
jgi:hypothetical protein